MTTEKPAIDAVFAALADGQRRALLTFLVDATEATVEELSAVIEGQASGYRRGGHGSELVDRLHHVHLPKLAAADLVDYDHSSGLVEYVGGSEIEELLATVSDEPYPE